jgi:hypothetical protein
MTVVEALAEHLGVFKKLDDRNQVYSKTSRSTAVTAVFQWAVVVKSRAVPVPWKVEKICRQNGHGTRATGAVEPVPGHGRQPYLRTAGMSFPLVCPHQ